MYVLVHLFVAFQDFCHKLLVINCSAWPFGTLSWYCEVDLMLMCKAFPHCLQARYGRLPEKFVQLFGLISPWTAVSLFLWAPVTQLVRSLLCNPTHTFSQDLISLHTSAGLFDAIHVVSSGVNETNGKHYWTLRTITFRGF